SGAAFNSFERIVTRLQRQPRFELRLGAHALRLRWNGARGRVDGVDILDRNTSTRSCVEGDAVVVAAGPLARPELLLQSMSADFPAGLGNTHAVLGRFLHAHPKDWCVLEFDRPMPRLDQPLYVTRAPYDESPPLSGASLTIGPLAKWDRLLSFVGATTRQFGLVTFATMLPQLENQVRLHPERRDQFGTPMLDIRVRYAADVAQ